MDVENPGTALERTGSAPIERATRSRTAWRFRSRWLVHLGLLASFAGAFATLQLLHIATPSMPTWGSFSRVWSLSIWRSVATGLVGCWRNSGALAHGSSAR